MSDFEDQIEAVKSTLTEPLPTPPEMSGTKATPHEILQRLNWGEPALTIVDVRDREAFNSEHIQGAISMPADQLPQSAEPALDRKRDIYIYSDGDDRAAMAANGLREAGYISVAEIDGGLAAWKAIGGAMDGSDAIIPPEVTQETLFPTRKGPTPTRGHAGER